MANKPIPLALVSLARRWHLVRDPLAGGPGGVTISLCGRVWIGRYGYTLSHDRQDDDQLCGHCANVRWGINNGRSPLKVAMTEARDEPT